MFRRCFSVARIKLPAKELLKKHQEQMQTPLAPTTIEVPMNSRIVKRYQELCQQHPNLFVMMQVGDFYEVFGEAARRVAPLLDIALGWTDRSQRMEMTGVPVRSIETHLEKLLRAGHSVVLCDQSSLDGGKSFERHPTRIITPGTVTEEGLLEGGRHNFILSISKGSLAWLDLSTGLFRVASPVDPESLLVRLLPKEVVTDSNCELVDRIRLRWPKVPIQTLGEEILDDEELLPKTLADCFTAAKHRAMLLNLTTAEQNAASLLLQYILRTQLNHRPYIEVPTRLDERGQMQLESMTMASLDLLTADRREASLLTCVDQTITAAGARLLSLRLRAPLTDPTEIDARLDEVERLVQNDAGRDRPRELLAGQRDIERAYQRLALDRPNGGPRDLAAIGQSLLGLADLFIAIREAGVEEEVRFEGVEDREALIALGREIERALEARPPARLGEAPCIKRGYSLTLDALRDGTQLDTQLAELCDRYTRQTGKSSLRITKGRLSSGWWVEVSKSDGPISAEGFELAETGPGGKLRYRTPELRQLQTYQVDQLERVACLEEELYRGLRQRVLSVGSSLIALARGLAEVDVQCALAHLAKERGWIRPEISRAATPCLIIEAGRHPVVEMSMATRPQGGIFTANHVQLEAASPMALITGPNMGGKSTYLRQTALLCILAQMGSFVPAKRMLLTPVDYLGTRIGAADDLTQDRSTFLVEMAETATLLRQATRHSLLLLDELGRGTAAREGLAIAQAVVSHLQSIGCRCLFATHYAELAELPDLQLLMTRVHSHDGHLVFDHRVVPGVAKHSHAIEVAQMAGIPASVISSARSYISSVHSYSSLSNDGDLQRIRDLLDDLDNLSPRQCQDRLYEIRQLLQ